MKEFMNASVTGIIVGMTSDGHYLIIETDTKPTTFVKVLDTFQDLPDISELRGKEFSAEDSCMYYNNGEITVMSDEIDIMGEKDEDRNVWPGKRYNDEDPPKAFEYPLKVN